MLIGKAVPGKMLQQCQRFTVSKAESDGEVGISFGWPKCCPPLKKNLANQQNLSVEKSVEKNFRKLEFVFLAAVRNSFLGCKSSVPGRK